MAARVYILRRGAGVLATSNQILEAIRARLQPLKNSGDIKGYMARVCHDREDLAEDSLDEAEVLAAAAADYPITWLNVTFDPAKFDAARLQPIEQEFDSVLILTSEPA